MSRTDSGAGRADLGPDRLRPSAFRSLVMAAASLVCAVVGIGMWRDGVAFAWVFTVTMAAASAFFIAHRLPGAYGLRFDDAGFEVTEMYSRRRFAWRDVAGFAPRRGLLHRFVEFEWTGGDAGPQKMRLNDTYGLSADRLAQTLNARRSRAAPAPGRSVWRTKGSREG